MSRKSAAQLEREIAQALRRRSGRSSKGRSRRAHATLAERLAVARDRVLQEDVRSYKTDLKKLYDEAQQIVGRASSADDAVEIYVESRSWIHPSYEVSPLRARFQVAATPNLAFVVQRTNAHLDPVEIHEAAEQAQAAAASDYLASGEVPDYEVASVQQWV